MEGARPVPLSGGPSPGRLLEPAGDPGPRGMIALPGNRKTEFGLQARSDTYRRARLLGIWLRHRRSARQAGLDRAPDASLHSRSRGARLLLSVTSRRLLAPRARKAAPH